MMHKKCCFCIQYVCILSFLLLFILFSIPDQLFAQGGSWQEIHPAQTPGNRSGHTMVNINGNIYLFGGIKSNNQPSNDLSEFSPMANTWGQVMAPDPPPARAYHSAVAVDNKMVIFGGIDKNYQVLNDIWEFDPTTDTWVNIGGTNPPPARSDQTMSNVNGKIIICGGLDSQGQPLGDTWTFDATTSSWTKGQDFPGSPNDSYGSSAVVSGGKVTLFGVTNKAYSYDPVSDDWETVNIGNPPSSTSLSASAQIGDYGFRFGGEDNSTANVTNQAYYFDAVNNSWAQAADMPSPLASSAAASYTLGGLQKSSGYSAGAATERILLYGGMDANWQATGRTFIYTPAFTIPVELSSFTANQVENGILLVWETKTESNNYGFEVERKLDESWEKISFIKGHGSTAEPQRYRFTDNITVNVASIHYRLKQLDFDGAFKYSPVVTIHLNSPTDFKLLQNYPNPFSAQGGDSKTTIQFSLKKESPVLLQVYDIGGRLIKTLVNESRQPGIYKAAFAAQNLAAGVYFYRIKMGSFQAVKKIVLLE